jgi:ABC-type transporter Mla subunit MlaD
MIADLFLESNRFIAKMELKRQKLADSIVTAIGTVANLIQDASAHINKGLSNVNSQVANVSQMKDQISKSLDSLTKLPTEPNTLANAFENIKQTTPQGMLSNMKSFSNKIKESANLPTASVGQGRKRLSTRRHDTSKWMKTRRIRFAKH